MGWFLYDRDFRHERVKVFTGVFTHGLYSARCLSIVTKYRINSTLKLI